MNGTQITEVVIVVGVLFFCLVGWKMRSGMRGAAKASLNPITGRFEYEQGVEPAGTSIKNSNSTSGGVTATNNTGSGVELDGVTANKDIVATNNAPPSSPKA
jgi:hypothetical protein